MPDGREFYKMSGSGNDFIFVDARTQAPGHLEEADVVRRLCARGTGVGADGIVFLEPSPQAELGMRYLNSDGSVAALCGNATLCAARLHVALGGANTGEVFTIATAAGVLRAQVGPRGIPKVEMPAVEGLDPAAAVALAAGERRAGFAQVGIPHLVLLCDDIESVDLIGRGRPLRHDPAFSAGTNVDFVAQAPGGRWFMRTYERGVEGETLACGTGAVASAVLLDTWGLAAGSTTIVTRSGQELAVSVDRTSGGIRPWLAGEGRIVYRGVLVEV